MTMYMRVARVTPRTVCMRMHVLCEEKVIPRTMACACAYS